MIYLAQGERVPRLALTAETPFPATAYTAKGVAAADALHRGAAEEIVEALWASLPGGTLDHVLILMMQRRASSFVVRLS